MSKELIIKVNEASLEVAHIQKDRTQFVVLSTFTVSFNNKILSETDIIGVSEISYHLKNELKARKINTKKVTFVINSNSIYARKIKVVKQKNPKDFLNLLIVKTKEDNIFPISLDDYYVTYSELGECATPKLDTTQSLPAKKSDEIEKFISNTSSTSQDLSSKASVEVQSETEANTVKESDLGKIVNSKEKMTHMECMVYVIPKTMVDSLESVATSVRLDITNIEYVGNSLYQYTLDKLGANADNRDFIMIHVTSINAIITSVSNREISTQHLIDFSYEDLCKPFFENIQLFRQDTIAGVFRFIEYYDFLNKDETKEGYDQFSPRLAELLKRCDQTSINMILSVQTQVLQKLATLTDGISSFLVNSRTNNLRPSWIFYYNESGMYPNIIDTIEYYSKLRVDLIDPLNNPNLIFEAAAKNPIDFSISLNTDKALNAKTESKILEEVIVAVVLVVVIIFNNLFLLGTQEMKIAELNRKIELANDAKDVHLKMMNYRNVVQEIGDFSASSETILNYIDKVFDEIERISLTGSYMEITSITANGDVLNVTMTADSKNSVIWFCQQLECMKYVSEVKWSSLTEVTEGDNTYATSRKVSVVFNIYLEFPKTNLDNEDILEVKGDDYKEMDDKSLKGGSDNE